MRAACGVLVLLVGCHTHPDPPTSGAVAIAAVQNALDPRLSSEHGIDLTAPGSASGERASAAFDGENWLVVWQRRVDLYDPDRYDIYGARVRGTDGAVLDAAAIPLGVGVGDQMAPVVAYGAGTFLVAWTDKRGGVRGTRVDPASGRGLDGDGAVLASSGFASALGHDGTSFFLAWIGGDNRLRGERIRAADLAVLDPGGFAISGPGSYVEVFDGANSVAMGQSGTRFYLVWNDWRNLTEAYVLPLYGALVDTRDASVGAEVRIWDRTAWTAQDAVAGDGDGFLVVWEDQDGKQLRSARVDAGGRILDPSGVIVGGEEREISPWPSVAWDGQRYLVAQSGLSSEIGVLVDPATGLADGPSFRFGQAQTPTQVVSGRDAALAVISGVLGQRVRGDQPLDDRPFLVSRAADAQASPRAAWDGRDWLLAWSDARVDTPGIYVTRVGVADLAGRDGAGTFVAAGSDPALACAATTCLVAWVQSGPAYDEVSVRAARVRAGDGALLDPGGFLVTTVPGASRGHWAARPAVAGDGRGFLVVWMNVWQEWLQDPYPRFIMHSALHGVRVGDGGTVVDPAPIVLGDGSFPDAARVGARWLVVGLGGGHWVDDSGSVGAPFVLGNGTAVPTVAGGPDQALIVWPAGDVVGRRVTAAGVFLDAKPLVISAMLPGWQALSPRVAWDGASYQVAWSALYPSWIEQPSATFHQGAQQTWVSRVRDDGTLVPPPVTLLDDHPCAAGCPVTSLQPAVAAAGPSRVLVAYSRFDPDPPFEAWRVRWRDLAVPALDVCPAIDVAPAAVPDGVVGDDYPETRFAATVPGVYALAVTAGALPAGLGFAPDATLSGVPERAGVARFEITAIDGRGCTGARWYELTVSDAIAIDPPGPPDAGPPDGGPPDGGPPPVGGGTPDTPPVGSSALGDPAGGCGCSLASASRPGGGPGAGWLLWLWITARRRASARPARRPRNWPRPAARRPPG